MCEKLIGIYQILNTKTNKSYIGQSNNIKLRFKTHKKNLESNIHINKKLQSSYNKYGIGVFQFNIIEIVNDCENLSEKLNDLEIFYVDKFNSFYNGYNLTFGGDNRMFGHTQIKYKKRILYHIDGSIIEATADEMNKMFNSKHFTYLFSGSYKKYMGWSFIPHKKIVYPKYTFYHKDGDMFNGTIHQFMNKFNLKYEKINLVINNKIKSTKGWYFNNIHQSYTFYHRNGELFNGTVYGLSNKYNLEIKYLNNLIYNKRNNYKGWRLTENLIERKNKKKLKLNKKDISPTLTWINVNGEIFYGTIYEFAKYINTSVGYVRISIKKNKKIKGWIMK